MRPEEIPRNEGAVNLEELESKPIPKLPSITGWKEVKLLPSEEPMVAIGVGTIYQILSSSIYFGEHNNSPYGINQI